MISEYRLSCLSKIASRLRLNYLRRCFKRCWKIPVKSVNYDSLEFLGRSMALNLSINLVAL